MINYGNGMIFPDAWAYGPPDPPEGPECVECGSSNVNLDGWDIDKCQDCGHWRYRGQEEK